MSSLNIYWSILRDNRDFRQLYIARLVSFGGDWFLVVPLVGLVYEASDSPFAAAALVAIRALPPLILAPVTGFVSDRFDRKKVLVITDVIRAGLALSLLLTDVISGRKGFCTWAILDLNRKSPKILPDPNGFTPERVVQHPELQPHGSPSRR